jgi:hypothetical protein
MNHKIDILTDKIEFLEGELANAKGAKAERIEAKLFMAKDALIREIERTAKELNIRLIKK